MIAILTPCHKDFSRVERQIINYNKFFGASEIIHILHVAKEASEYEQKYFEITQKHSNTFLSKRKLNTGQYCTIGAFISCTNELTRNKLFPNYIYMHTDSDLIFRSGAADHIKFYENAYEKYTTTLHKDDWYWTKKMRTDPVFRDCFKYLGLDLDEINIGRQEGSFFSWDIWIETINLISTHYNEFSFFRENTIHWPVEECLIPSIVNQILKTPPRCKNIIHTKTTNGVSDRNDFITLSDIEEFKSLNDRFGAKWFSPNLSSDLKKILL